VKHLVTSLLLYLVMTAAGVAADQSVLLLRLQDAIGPATSDFIHSGLSVARERGAGLVVLQLDTPGGLDTAMRDIIRAIIASPVPVAIYVSPSGARAASAGTYMLYAAHIAAMAPGTNLGAATPVQIGGFPDIMPGGNEGKEKEDRQAGKTDKDGAENAGDEEGGAEQEAEQPNLSGDAMTHKMVNDAVAYIRSLAEMRGRNAEWAEQAVREAASLSSEQAVEQGVVDILAVDLRDLLQQVDGRVVEVNNVEVTLQTAAAEIITYEPDWRNRLLSIITNPNVAYILLLLGIYGLFFELANPGFVLPGVIGGISLLLALYSMQVLPVNFAGVALILLGIAFMVAELFVPSFGALGIGGIIAFIIGSIILFDVEGRGNLAISKSLIFAVAAVTAGFFLIVIRLVFKAHRKPVVSGVEEMVGSLGEAAADFDKRGFIHVHGEDWQAETSQPVKAGDCVRVTGITGLVLKIEPTKE
jgi:membrane-bound serine protease (ClpP class)